MIGQIVGSISLQMYLSIENQQLVIKMCEIYMFWFPNRNVGKPLFFTLVIIKPNQYRCYSCISQSKLLKHGLKISNSSLFFSGQAQRMKIRCSDRNYPLNGGEVWHVYPGWLGFYSHVDKGCVHVVQVVVKQREILLSNRQGATSLCRDMCQVFDRLNLISVSYYYIATIMQQVGTDVNNIQTTCSS